MNIQQHKDNPHKKTSTINKSLHPRNLHKHGYDFPILIASYPPLTPFIKTHVHGDISIDFANPKAVKALNTALLKKYYHINDWHIPEGALCPPIPGRVDYIHYIAELLNIDTPNVASTKNKRTVRMLDIGTGANGIYPLLACKIYGWHCVGSDINMDSINNVNAIIASNPDLAHCFELRIQADKNRMFDSIIQSGEHFDVSVCNPPFHASQQEAEKGNKRKLDNLAKNRTTSQKIVTNKSNTTLNFGGKNAELWCKGGERLFLKKLIKESQIFSSQCTWFTSLISKIDNVKPAKKLIKKLGATNIQEIEMKQGNKVTRILAWTFV